MAKRNLYLNNTEIEQALNQYRHALQPFLQKQSATVPVIKTLGRITASAVYARCNSPLYDSAAMDGIAVRSEATVGAAESTPVLLQAKTDFHVVDTGDPVLPPYDSVIMAEELEEQPDGTVQIRAAAAPWQHIRPVGEDIVQGEMILPSFHKIRPIDIGVLLSGGITEIEVWEKPKVAIFPTGTEMVEPGTKPAIGDIIESNSRMFEALIQEAGGNPTRFAPIPDVYEEIKNAIEKAVQNYDMVLVNAGSSAGTEDYTVHVLRELGEVVIHGVAMKPGKPVILAMVQGKPVIGLPGYPVSAFLAYQNFTAPILAAMAGTPQAEQQVVQAVLTRRLVSSLKHREYVRVKVGKVGKQLVAAPLARGAGAAMSLVRADGFCVIEQNEEGVLAGQLVDVILSRPLPELEHTVVSIGSHDLLLDVLADMLPEQFAGMHLSSTHVGSMGGLLALQKGETHIAPVHLLDGESGEYNRAMVQEVIKNKPMALIKGVGRTQGIMVQPDNPLQVKDIEDLPRVRYINRQRGAGTRILLDYKLKKSGIYPENIQGYTREAATHMAVAAAVKAGSADAGMGIYSAAMAMRLSFIPVGEEEYDFALPQEYLELPHIKAFIAVLKSDEFKEKLQHLGGYTTQRSGEVVLLDGESK